MRLADTVAIVVVQEKSGNDEISKEAFAPFGDISPFPACMKHLPSAPLASYSESRVIFVRSNVSWTKKRLLSLTSGSYENLFQNLNDSQVQRLDISFDYCHQVYPVVLPHSSTAFRISTIGQD